MAFEFDPTSAKPVDEAGTGFDPSTAEPVKPSGAIRRVADAGLALAKGVVGVPEAAVGIADLVTGGRAGRAAEGLGVRFKDAKQVLTDFQSPEQHAADAEVQKAEGFLPTLGAMVRNPSTIANAALESAPSMILGGGVARGAMAVAPKLGAIGAGALGEGAVAAGQNAEQVRQEDPNGTLTAGQSALLAGSGALTAGISRLSGGIANKLGIGDAQTMIAAGKLGPVGQQAVEEAAKKNFARKIAEGFAVEGALQELPQSMQEQVAQNLAQGKPWDEGVGAAGAQGLLVGGVTGAIAGPFSGEPQVTPPPPAAAPAGPMTAALAAGGAWKALGITDPADELARQKRISETGQAWQDIAPTTPAEDLAAQKPVEQRASDEAGAAASRATDERIAAVGQQWQDLGITDPSTDLQRQRTGMTPAEERGVDANAGPLSGAAAMALNAGVTQGMEAQNAATANDITDGGTPFKGAIPARRAADKAGEGWSVVKVPDGYVVRPSPEVIRAAESGKPLEQSAKATDAKASPQSAPAAAAPVPQTGSTATALSPAPVPAAGPAGTGADANPALKGVPHGQRQGESAPSAGVGPAPVQSGADRAQPAAVRAQAAGPAADAAGAAGSATQGAKPLTVGMLPNTAEPVTVKNGQVHIGKEPALNFDTGEPIAAPEGATDTQIKQLLKDAGAVSRRQKFFGGTTEQASAAQPQPQDTQTPVAARPGPQKAEAGTAAAPAGKSSAVEAAGVAPTAPKVVTVTTPEATSAARPANWRTNFMVATQVAKGVGIPYEQGRTLADVVALIEAKDGKAETISALSKEPEKPSASGISIGTRNLVHRQANAAKSFVDSVVEQFGLTREQASAALDRMMKDKLVKLDAISGQFQLKDGRAWDKDVMLRAAESATPAAAAPPPARYGVDNTPLAEGGKPFKTQLAAAQFRRKHSPQSRIVAVDGGFALRDATDKESAAGQAAGKRRQASARAASYEKNPFLTFLASHGLFHVKGHKRSQKAEFSPDKNPLVAGYGPVFKRTGLMPDLLAQRAAEEGYLPPGTEDAKALESLIHKRGERVAPLFAEGQAEIEAARDMPSFEDMMGEDIALSDLDFTPDEIEAGGYADLTTEQQAEYRALLALAEAQGIDVETIKEDAYNATANQPEQAYYAAATQALQAAIARSDASGSQDAGAQGDAQSTAQAEGLDAGPAEIAEAKALRYKTKDIQRVLDKGLDPTDGFDMHILSLSLKSARAYDAIMRDNGGDPSGIEYRKPPEPKYPNIPTKYAVVLPNASKAGEWRISYFDARGFSHHDVAPSVAEATATMAQDGFTIKDEGALDRLAATREWALGTDYAALIDQYNRKLITSDEFAARQKALNDDYERDTNALTAPTRAEVLAQQAQREAEQQRKDEGGDKPLPAKTVTGDQIDMLNPQGGIFDQPAQGPSENVSKNTVFTDDAAAKARAVIRAKLYPAAPQATASEGLADAVQALPASDRATLEAHYGQRQDSAGFLDRVREDVATFVNKGAQAVASAIRSIIKGIAEGVLAVGLVFNPMGLKSDFSFDLPAVHKQTITQTRQVKAEPPLEAIAGMSGPAITVYENMAPTAKASGKGFIIADKPAGMMHVFAADGSLIAQDAALYGKDKGDRMGASSLKGGPKVTPAGGFGLRWAQSEYAGGQQLNLVGSEDADGAVIAVHAAWLGDPKENRLGRLASPSADDNRISYGCINSAHDTFLNKVLPEAPNLDGGMAFVLPDESDAETMFPAGTTTQTTTIEAAERNAREGNIGGQQKGMGDRSRPAGRSGATRREALDPDLLQAGITMAGYHVEAGNADFASYASAMLEDLGEAVRPYLKSWYMAMKYDPQAADFIDKMSPASVVEGFDLANLAAPSKPAGDRVAKPGKTSGTVTSTDKIEDFGEKLEGARKDYAATLKDAMDQDVAAVPLSKSWPEPDYDKLLSGGADPFVVAFIHAARDEVPTKPQSSWKVKRWVDTVSLLRDMASKLLSGETSREKLQDVLGQDNFKNLRLELGGRAELYQRVGHAQSLKGVRVTVGEYSLYKGVEYKPAKVIWAVEKAAKASAFSNWPSELATGATREEAIAAFVNKVKETPATTEKKAATFDLWRENGQIHLGKKIGREYITLKTFAEVKEARAYRDANLAELTTALEKYRSTPFERKGENAPRVGEDHRGGARMTPEVFADTFGFRGVQFGNYVENTKRQQDLNDAYDSLMDMAAVLGVPPKALSLNGQLGLAFGARGKGGINAAAAHYETDKVVINLTKNSGAGSLAHEWFHAVDNYFAKLDGGKGGMMTEGAVNPAVRAEMLQAFKKVQKVITDSPMRFRARNLDKRRSKPYWSTYDEMAARSFEAYIIAKLQDQNAANDYLANVVSEQFWQAQDALMGHEGEQTYPYPTEAEMGPVREAFGQFFDAVQTKETDSGVAMFSKKPDTASQRAADAAVRMDPTAVQRAVSELTRDWLRKPDIVILESMRDEKVPQAVAREYQRQESQGGTGTVQGFHLKGTVYIVADAMRGPQDVREVLFHESLGHFGLRGFFGKALNPMLEEIVATRKFQVAKKAREYGLDMAKGADRLMAAEEVLAELAQTRPELDIVQRAIAAIRIWLRENIAAFKDLQLTDNEIIERFILPARGYAERGTSGKTTFTRSNNEQAQAQASVDVRTVQVDGVRYPAENANGQPVHPTFEGQKAFWRWFGDSAVVDDAGRPVVVYHGTTGDFDAFDPALLGLSTRHSTSQLGFFFSADPAVADQFTEDPDSEESVPMDSANTMPVYLSIKNPRMLTAQQFMDLAAVTAASKKIGMHGYIKALRAPGVLARILGDKHDGILIKGDPKLAGTPMMELQADTWVAYRPEQIKSAIGNNGQFDPSDDRVQFSKKIITGATNRQYTPEQLRAMGNVGFQVEQPSMKERAQALWQDAGKKLAQGIVDQFAPVKDLDKQAYGLLRLAKGASGAFEAFLRGGQLKLTDNVYDFDDSKRGGVVDRLLIPLQGEHHDFMRWVAANRAERLMAEGKENLFTPQDIADLKTLNAGQLAFDYTIRHGAAGRVTRNRAEAYRDSLTTFNEFNKNALDMAEQSGLIDAASRHLWEHEFYVPFYRVADDADGGIRGMNIKGSVVRQQAFKQLKGGKGALNADLLDNTLMNWAHLLDAAAKNRAAKATLEAAERMGVAIGAPQYTANQIGAATGNKNGAVWFMDGGQKRFFVVDDPYVLTAISALEFAGMRSPVMNAMGAFKHALTIGVTASPFFKIRNLIRDSVQVIGTGNISFNPGKNIAQGWKLTNPKSDAYFRLLAGGGTIHFGTMLEGSEAKRIQALVESGVDDSTILNSDAKVKAFYRKFIEPGISAYNELGNRGEAINRAALYAQLTAQGMSHADASLQARDLMDFSMQGSFTSVRFLTQVVPFFNARLQGSYKLGRAAKENPARFGAVLGATALFSLGLLAAYSDDDDWKKRELWDRQNFWWFKFGGTAFRIPKPFEIGAIATLAEHGAELMFDDEMTGKRFRQAALKLVGDNLAMNPVPQLVKPVLDVYANTNSFTGRPIESMGMERLKPEYRFNDRTSMAARGASTAINAVTGLIGADGPSPVQIDHLIRGYFGWLGSFVVGAGDVLARPATGQPAHAAPDYWKAATGGMVSDMRDAPSRYVSQMYEQARGVEQAYGTWRALQKEGKPEEAAAFRESNPQIAQYAQVERVKRGEAFLNQQIKRIERSDLSGDEKRQRIRVIQERKDNIARGLAVR
jgi:hypothetical protein